MKRIAFLPLLAPFASGKVFPRFLSKTLAVVLAIGFPLAGMAAPETSAPALSARIDSIAQQAYLKASDTESLDQFGYSAAVDGDTAVVGSAAEAAYIFVKTGGTWTQQAILEGYDPNSVDGFGFSVSISGDTVVVGAPLDDSNSSTIDSGEDDDSASHAGAAYVFQRLGTTWGQVAYLKASDAVAGDQFGGAVDVDGETIVVGAKWRDSAAGAAYVFTLADTGMLPAAGPSWDEQDILEASNYEADDQFGDAVAVDGDTVVIGAKFESSDGTGDNNDANRAGAAYVFVRDGEDWSEQAMLKASNAEALDQFGSSVSVDGDTVVVGAPEESDSGTDAGAAYVFARSGTVWSEQAYLKASNAATGHNFGESVSLSGDTLVIGAMGESTDATGVDGSGSPHGAADSGAAYLFTRNGATWSEQAYLKASNTDAGDQFGIAAAVSGSTVVIGADQESSDATEVNGDEGNGGNQNGAAYVFEISFPPAPVVNPDTARPSISFLKKKRLKNPRPRHRIKGLARDDVAVSKVEVRVRGKGWRKAKLRRSGRWIFRTSRLESGRNVFKVRARDTSGNRSKVKRVKAIGK